MNSKSRTALLILLILMAAAVLLVRSQRPRISASVEAPAAVSADPPPPVGHSIAVTPPARTGIGTVEICGHGKIPVDPGDARAIHQVVGALTKTAGTRWLAALQNSGDLRARVAGLWLDGKLTGGDPLQPVTEQTRDAVVELAAGAADPAVYAMALSMCGTFPGTASDGACARISLQRWADLDPANAVPWLVLAGNARRRHNDREEADAFSQAAVASKVDSYSDSLYAFAEPEMPRDATPLERSFLAVEVVGVEAALSLPQGSVLSQRCSDASVQDTLIRQQCSSLAELLVTRGTTLMDLGLGARIGARAGWSPERVRELMQDRNALEQVIMQVTPADSETLWTCEAVGRMNAYMALRARKGELGAAWELLEQSGETVPELARKYTEYLDGIRQSASNTAGGSR
jgi:hypothetical protein